MNPLEAVSASPSTFPTFAHPAPPRVLALWDAALSDLWSADRTVATEAATTLYTPEATTHDLTTRATEAIERFSQQLMQRTPLLPSTPEGRYRAAVVAVWEQLHRVRESPALPFIEDSLAIALRPVRRLQSGMLTSEICAALYDFHRGVWTPHLTRPQLQKIQSALSAALTSLPPEEMEVFWENLHSSSSLMRGAMCLGLEWLTSCHAVPHLLSGLDRSTGSETRFAIVDNLARIGDPCALPRLYALRRTAALTDWPLARRISATINVIEHLNRGRSPRSLLRPAQAPPPDSNSLLRPTSETDPAHATLLRPSGPN